MAANEGIIMQLTAITGIGPAYGARLREAGLTDVAQLAMLEDLAPLHDATGIPLPRLESFRDEARAHTMDDEPDLGIATEGISHDIGEALKHTFDDLKARAETKWRHLRDHAEARWHGRRDGGHA